MFARLALGLDVGKCWRCEQGEVLQAISRHAAKRKPGNALIPTVIHE